LNRTAAFEQSLGTAVFTWWLCDSIRGPIERCANRLADKSLKDA
jgi:hypothetical protein